MDRSKDGPDLCAGNHNLFHLKGDGAGVTHEAGPNLDQFELQAGQRSVGHDLEQLDTSQEGGQIVGPRL
jgi:hypothetical protein